ncbi:MAG: GNAT family N-acetyltransferase [Nocardioidaceae bacterium]
MSASVRRAGPADAGALLALERSASLAALGHVFPPERFPYPSSDVLARWHLVLADPGCVTLVDGGDPGPEWLVAWDDHATVRHLAVAPEAWGRGAGRRALGLAVGALGASGAGEARLWCLADNSRARGFYESLGWRVTGAEQPAPWPPYPLEVEYVLPLRRLAP